MLTPRNPPDEGGSALSAVGRLSWSPRLASSGCSGSVVEVGRVAGPGVGVRWFIKCRTNAMGYRELLYLLEGATWLGVNTSAATPSGICDEKSSMAGRISGYDGWRDKPGRDNQVNHCTSMDGGGLPHAPRSIQKLKSLSRSHVHAQTVKNRSSCSSSACCPNEDKIEEREPWVN